MTVLPASVRYLGRGRAGRANHGRGLPMKGCFAKVPVAMFVASFLVAAALVALIAAWGAVGAIMAVRPTCGCTATVLSGKRIPPGGTGTLEVTYNPEGQQGSVRKSILVSSNDPDQPNLLLTIRAHVTPVEFPKVESGHPPFAGQSLLIGSCADCHAAPAAGKSGEALYGAICAMCHGEKAAGGKGPSLRDPEFLSSHDDRTLINSVAYGTVNPRMPGFSQAMGGPLSDEQIRSLISVLRAWGPLPSSTASRAAPEKRPAPGR